MSEKETSQNAANLLGFQRALSGPEKTAREALVELLETSPIPRDEKIDNLGVFADHVQNVF